MPTQFVVDQTEKALRSYRKDILFGWEKREQDETTTRTLYIDKLVEKVFGYDIGLDVSMEQRIRGQYADYVIRIGRKEYFVVEAKAINIDINSNHLKQARQYALDEGINWAVLTNGKQIELYRVPDKATDDTIKVFSYDLSDLSQMKKAAEQMAYLTKKSLQKGELDAFWKKFDTLSKDNIAKALHTDDAISAIRRQLKKSSGLYFAPDEIRKSLSQLLADK